MALSTTISQLLLGVDAEPATLGTRRYVYRDCANPHDPDRPLGRPCERAAGSGDASD